jgi:hypothetical protein
LWYYICTQQQRNCWRINTQKQRKLRNNVFYAVHIEAILTGRLTVIHNVTLILTRESGVPVEPEVMQAWQQKKTLLEAAAKQ